MLFPTVQIQTLQSVSPSSHPARWFSRLFGLLAVVLLLEGCAAAVVGTAVVSGVSVVRDRRTTATQMEDQAIEFKAAQIRNDYLDISNHSELVTTSYNLVVLVIGHAESPQIHQRYTKLVADIPRVRKVIDEVSIGSPRDLKTQSNDFYLASRVKLALFDTNVPGFDPTRVNVEVYQSVVYLLGLVSEREAEGAAEAARYIPGVSRVVKVFEYVKPN